VDRTASQFLLLDFKRYAFEVRVHAIENLVVARSDRWLAEQRALIIATGAQQASALNCSGSLVANEE
jgi:hypothetical protein